MPVYCALTVCLLFFRLPIEREVLTHASRRDGANCSMVRKEKGLYLSLKPDLAMSVTFNVNNQLQDT